MPKMLHVHDKPHHAKPYTRVTSHSMHRLFSLKAEDQTNLTPTDRGISEYEETLHIRLKHIIISMAKKKKRKIKILDSGCGEGIAIDELLSDESLRPYLKSITGISKNYFENICNVMNNHPDRFYYYCGTSQDVLFREPGMHDAFDLIFDAWGAYPYSKNKIALLELYHHALQFGGHAYIYRSSTSDLIIKNNDGGYESLINYAVTHYPETIETIQKANWSYKYNQPLLIIQKTTERWPLPKFKLISSKEKPSISHPPVSSRARLGNAVKFDDVIVEETHGMQLRPLPLRLQETS